MNATVHDRVRHFLNVITFIDLPIRRKFLLFGLGVLFWFLMMYGATLLSLRIFHDTSHHVMESIMPRERVAQKVARSLQGAALDAVDALRAGDARDTARALEGARRKVDHAATMVNTLTHGGRVVETNDAGTILENFPVEAAVGDAAAAAYVKEVAEPVAAARKKLAELAETKGGGKEAMEAKVRELRHQLERGATLSTDFSSRTSRQYSGSTEYLASVIDYSTGIVTVVLAISTLLLIVFSLWISNSIAKPVQAIIDQIHSLARGDVDLTKKIVINSEDEIGTLSKEFNGLMESIHGMTTFKKVIEEDDSLEDVYTRLGEVFGKRLGLEEFMVFDVLAARNKMNPVYPLMVNNDDLMCNPDILDNCDLCKAKKTGHPISSLNYPRVCKQFLSPDDKEHFCIPMIVGGSTGGVLQFTFDKQIATDPAEMENRLYNAKQYIKESLSVIEAKRLMNTLRESALKDPLTGLHNRRFLQEYTENLVAGVRRRGKHIGLIMCDLDYFKQVNDTHGHNAGDIVLKETAAILRKCVRDADMVIRFGGEEFLVVVLDIREGESERVAEKIRAGIAETKIRLPEGGVIKKTISLGVSEFPTDTESFWQAIKFADVALYKAKETGRNRVVRFAETMWNAEQF